MQTQHHQHADEQVCWRQNCGIFFRFHDLFIVPLPAGKGDLRKNDAGGALRQPASFSFTPIQV